MVASLFGPVEQGADALVRMFGGDPSSAGGAAVAFFLFEFIKVSVLILAISWLMALVRRSLPMDRVRRWLGTPAGRALGYPAAAGFGAVTPFCSCSSVPLFIGFVEAGIPVGVTFAFLITSPLVNEIVVALFLASFGWKVAALYTGSGILLGILGGMIIQGLGAERLLSPFAKSLRDPEVNTPTDAKPCCGCGCDSTKAGSPPPRRAATSPTGPLVFKAAPVRTHSLATLVPVQPAPCCGDDVPTGDHGAAPSGCGCCSAEDRVDPRAQGALAFATSEAWSIYRQILLYLVLALALGAGMHGYLPEGFFADFFRSGAWWHVPAATAIGLPLYASANATVPILETLVAKGVPLGTGMALIMSAVGVSLPELVLLRRVMTVRLLALFAAVVSVGVILVGYLFNALPVPL